MSISTELNELMDVFVYASNGLFEITGRYPVTFEQGIYICAIAKPSKRLRHSLGVDREILVVASNFSDQQQRTIKLAKREIDSSAGRFESTVLVIVHKDVEGNEKLKNWGRTKGLSVLPIFQPNLDSNPAQLEKMLCHELYSHDPFDVTGPVSDDSNFFGRRDEAIDIARKLQRGQIRSCLGIRKIGKTSIINRIVGELRSNYDCITIMADCSRDDVWALTATQLLDSITTSVERALATDSGYISLLPYSGSSDLHGARDRLEKLALSLTKPLILIFDEIDYITPGSPTQATWRIDFNIFWRNLRSVYQECARQAHPVSLLIGGVSTYWFTVESIDAVENAALAFIPEEYLSPMPEGATVAMLKRLGRISGLQLEDSAAEAIARATANMPYWSRKCCSYIHRQVPISERPLSLNRERTITLIEKFVADEGAAISEIALRHLFRVHPNLLQAAQKCANGHAATVSDTLRRTLKRYGVLSVSDSLAGQMISEGFAALEANPSPDSQPSTNTTPAAPRTDNNLGEWAEELAAISKRRNLLEKRLREVTLNFLRFDSMSTGRLTEMKDRIIAILPENQRQNLKHLTAEETIGKFLWTDLYKLVSKEWNLFSKVFGDRELFLRNCEIINDRFDAHAKPADAADFALYRRSLQYIEDRLAKLQ